MALRTMSLARKECVPCRGGVPPFKGDELNRLSEQVEGWDVIEGHHLSKTYKFSNFVKALEFVNKVGSIAEQQGHHPNIFLTWGKARIETWTHKIDGLTESDFILAAKIDEVLIAQ